MTTTGTPERASSPTNAALNATATETNKPVATPDAPAPSAAAGNDHAAEPTSVVQTSEPEQATRVTEEPPRTDQPSRPQATDTPAERVSPEVESLKAMFPDFDVTIVQSVLESVNGDQERAADVLLGMSDPNYVSQQNTAKSQTELDEEFARNLMLEEQQQQASWHPDQQYPYPQDRRRGNVPYQPRIHQHHQGPYQGDQAQMGGPPQQQQPGGGGRDTMSEVQEQFTKFAETGKKTFSSLMTKVKAKMQEFDSSKNQSGSAQQTYWGSGTPSGAPSGSGPAQGEYPQYAPPSQPPPPGTSFSPPSGAVQGYDAQPPSAAGTGLGSVGSATTPVVSPAPTTADRIPPRPPSAGNVDPSKIGMLPKRPVSLLGGTANASQPQPSTNTSTRHDADEDELDYVENPFEDGRK